MLRAQMRWTEAYGDCGFNMSDHLEVRIFESELRTICDETLTYPDTETGGNLFGLFSHGRAPVIMLATRPAGRMVRSPQTLELDPKIQIQLETVLWSCYGVQCLGMWHSHHRMRLYEPSAGDRRRTASYAQKSHRSSYTEILANIINDRWADSGILAREVQTDLESNHEAQIRDPELNGYESDGQRQETFHERPDDRTRVLLTPFNYVDATSLVRAESSFTVIAGISPLRQTVETERLPEAVREAMRPAPAGGSPRLYNLGYSPRRLTYHATSSEHATDRTKYSVEGRQRVTWDKYQRVRLAMEKSVLEREFPNFAFYDPTGATYVHGRWTSNSGKEYELQIRLPAGYPDECPVTYITRPSPLPGVTKTIESYGTSHDMHTQASDRPGWVRLCTISPQGWSANYSIVKVIRKSLLWIIAYECYLEDGKPISQFLMAE